MIKQGVLKATYTTNGVVTETINWRVVRVEFDSTCNVTGFCNSSTNEYFRWYYNFDLTDMLALDAVLNRMADSNEYEWTTPMADVILPDLKLAFGSAIYGRNSDGTAPSGSIFLPRNANNHMLINYGGYLDRNSNTIIYGNNAEVRTRDSFKANDIELGKTTKQTISNFTTGWAAYSSSQAPTLRKYGNVVQFCGAFKNSSEITLNATQVTVCTLPEAYRPSQSFTALCQGSGMNKWLLTIDTDGSVKVSRYGTSSYVAASSGSWFAFNATWIVD